jgi:hypothetical protein
MQLFPQKKSLNRVNSYVLVSNLLCNKKAPVLAHQDFKAFYVYIYYDVNRC